MQKLLNAGVPGVRNTLFREYPAMFESLDVSPAPLLIRMDDVQVSAVLNEHGNEPDSNISTMREHMADDLISEALFQPLNSRLSVPSKVSEVPLIVVTEFDSLFPEYELYPLRIDT